jgi:LCP family protein required for cell wall assembly
MNAWGKAALAAMLVLLGLVWFGIGFEVAERWSQPLGPALDWPTLPSQTRNPANNLPEAAVLQTLTPPDSPLPAKTATSVSEMPVGIPASQTPDTSLPFFPTRTPHPNTLGARCGGPERMLILVIGSDTRANGYMYGLADVIRLVRVDFVNPGITVLEFSRDLWVEIPDISDHYGITHEKLNQAYLYGNRGFGYYDGPGLGPGLLAHTLDLNFGARPDHYIAINMQTFVRLVDAFGGIEINLPYTVDGRMSDQQTRADLFFEAGPQRLKGREALTLARLRIGNNADRSTHQSLIACSLRDAALKPSNIGRLPAIIEAFQGAVQTDLSPQEISALTCLAPQVPPQNIRFVSFTDSVMTASRIYDRVFKKQVFIYEADFNLMRLYVAAFQNGDWPPPVQPGLNPSTPASPEESFSCP